MHTTNVLAISDLQCPFEHRDALSFVQHVDKLYFPDGNRIVVNLGDEVDQHTLGKWPANPNGRSGSDELEEAKLRLSYWFDAFPKTKVCTSNHTYRAWKKAFLSGIPSQFMREVGDVYGAPSGWVWKDRHIIDDILFEHGEFVSGKMAALQAAEQNRMKTVIGHQHSFGGVIHSAAFLGQNIWGLNTGCLIDIDAYAFDYGRGLRKKPTLGCGVIVRGIPHFVPMILSKNGRWVKRV